MKSDQARGSPCTGRSVFGAVRTAMRPLLTILAEGRDRDVVFKAAPVGDNRTWRVTRVAEDEWLPA